MLLGRLLFLLLLQTLALQAHAGWNVAETARFRVYSNGPEKALVEQARLLERYDWLLRLMTGTPKDRPMPPLDIYLVNSGRALHALADLPKDTAGFYHAGASGTAAFSRRIDNADKTGVQILLHEYAHHFMRFHFPYPYPSWYVEGVAEYFSTADVADDTMTLGEASKNASSWLAYGTWIDADKLMTADAWQMKGDARAMFYAQGWLATHYLLRDPERSRLLSKYLSGIRDGGDPKAAFEQTFGMDFDAFGRRLRAYVGGRNATYTKLKTAPGAAPEPEVRVSALPAASDRLLLSYASLRTGAATGREDTLVDGIRGEAARHPGDPYAAEVLAGVEAEFGDPEKARNLLKPLLAARDSDAELNYLMGRSFMRSARDNPDRGAAHHAAARRHFARAFKVRPNHYQTLFNYVIATGDPRPMGVRQVLLQAQGLAPQVRDISLTLAMVLIAAGEFQKAETMLLTLVMDPHMPPSAYMRALLERARARSSDLTGLDLLAQD